MIRIENIETYGWQAAIRGMRNPMNSWDKSDTGYQPVYEDDCICDAEFVVGPNDLKLMKQLIEAGTDHRKFLRMINVTMDMTAPLYWWKEFDTYKVGTVRNSCSTMHKITAKEFTLDDFSHEHLNKNCFSKEVFNEIIRVLNFHRKLYLETKDKAYWWQMIQLLPSSYNQKATVQLNYEVLLNMFYSRKSHKLDEWVYFCLEITKLPYMEEFIND